MDKKNSVSEEAARIQGYRMPVYRKGAQHYVEFYVFNPATGKLERRKKMFDSIRPPKLRNETAHRFCQEIGARLRSGWNPFIEEACNGEYSLFSDACNKYEEYIKKLTNEGSMRTDTLVGYLSKLKILKLWISEGKKNIYYTYQFDSKALSEFLDYVFIDRNNTVTTRNNYLCWLSTFCTYLVQRQYTSTNPAANITPIKNAANKNRSVISANHLQQLSEYLREKNKHYLLACYILHYMFIRPKEMSKIKISDISIKDCTIRLYGENTKNHHDAVLTMPKKILLLMIELKTFDSPGNYYLFSDDFKPGEAEKSEKRFRDFWVRYVRRDLKFPDRYKFYSLKDTGITTMLKNNTDILTVRDQARHSNIEITDCYTPHDIITTNQAILDYDGDL